MATSFSGGGSRSIRKKTTDPGQATGKLYHLRLRVECTLFVIYKLIKSTNLLMQNKQRRDEYVKGKETYYFVDTRVSNSTV